MVAAGVLCCGCDGGKSARNSRVEELVAQVEQLKRSNNDLEARLAAGKRAEPAAAVAGTELSGESAERAGLAASVSLVVAELEKELMPASVEGFSQVRWAVIRSRDAVGKAASFAVVPFFSTGDGQWQAGWSRERIRQELSVGGAASRPLAADGEGPSRAVPPPQGRAAKDPVTSAPETPEVGKPAGRAGAAAGGLRGATPERGAGPSQTGAALGPGERLTTEKALDGSDIPVIIKADGTKRYIMKQ